MGASGRHPEQQAEFRFYAELNDFLPPALRYCPIAYRFLLRHPVKDAVEALGVPHTEVELIVDEGESVGFEHPVRDGHRISVYPVFESLDISPVLKVRSAPLRNPRFIADVHLGRLAAYLRFAGFDVEYRADGKDADLARSAAAGPRILLTRDAQLLKRKAVTHGYYIRSVRPEEQLAEVIRRFDLAELVKPFTRCARCNQKVRDIDRAAARAMVPEAVWRRYSRFTMCPACGRLYWEGSHHARLVKLMEKAFQREGAGDAATGAESHSMVNR